MHPQFDQRDQEILDRRQALLNERQGIKQGDFIRRLDGTLVRVTYAWDDCAQTNKSADSGSFYLGDGYANYSGALEPGIPLANLRRTEETMKGRVWFFHHNFQQAHSGVECQAEFPVWEEVTGG